MCVGKDGKKANGVMGHGNEEWSRSNVALIVVVVVLVVLVVVVKFSS
jgi:hypothetical protein